MLTHIFGGCLGFVGNGKYLGIFWKYFKVAKGLLARSLACGVHWESTWDWDSCSAGLANSLLCTLVTSCVHTNTSHLLCTPTRGLFRTIAQLHWSALQSPARSFSLECSPVCTVCPTSLCNSRHIAKCVRLHRCEATCSACVVHCVYLYFVSSACASVVCVANRPAVGLCPDMKAVNFRHDCFLPNPTSSTKNAKIIHPAHKMPECYISHKNSLNRTTSTHTKWISYIWYAKKPFATSSTKALPFRVGVLFFTVNVQKQQRWTEQTRGQWLDCGLHTTRLLPCFGLFPLNWSTFTLQCTVAR